MEAEQMQNDANLATNVLDKSKLSRYEKIGGETIDYGPNPTSATVSEKLVSLLSTSTAGIENSITRIIAIYTNAMSKGNARVFDANTPLIHSVQTMCSKYTDYASINSNRMKSKHIIDDIVRITAYLIPMYKLGLERAETLLDVLGEVHHPLDAFFYDIRRYVAGDKDMPANLGNGGSGKGNAAKVRTIVETRFENKIEVTYVISFDNVPKFNNRFTWPAYSSEFILNPAVTEYPIPYNVKVDIMPAPPTKVRLASKFLVDGSKSFKYIPVPENKSAFSIHNSISHGVIPTGVHITSPFIPIGNMTNDIKQISIKSETVELHRSMNAAIIVASIDFVLHACDTCEIYYLISHNDETQPDKEDEAYLEYLDIDKCVRAITLNIRRELLEFRSKIVRIGAPSTFVAQNEDAINPTETSNTIKEMVKEFNSGKDMSSFTDKIPKLFDINRITSLLKNFGGNQ